MRSSEMTTAMSWRKRHLGDDASRMHACLKLGKYPPPILLISYVHFVPVIYGNAFFFSRAAVFLRTVF